MKFKCKRPFLKCGKVMDACRKFLVSSGFLSADGVLSCCFPAGTMKVFRRYARPESLTSV